MGRIKTQLIKRTTFKLYRAHKDELKNNFGDNKAFVVKFTDIPSKKIRNTIAGYLTRLAKTNKEIL